MYPESALVLMIEDSATQAEVMAAHLTARGIDVVIATSGEQGLRLISAHQPTLVVLDLHLPGMTGYQVCKRIKRDPDTAHLPVIMLTSETDKQAELHSLELGVTAFIRKDEIAVEHLLEALQACDLLPE